MGLTAFHKFEDTKAAMEAWKGFFFFFGSRTYGGFESENWGI